MLQLMKASAGNRSVQRQERVAGVFVHGTLLFVGICSFVPFVMMILLSFKDMRQFQLERWILSFPLHWENYARAWSEVGRYLFNSVAIGLVTVAGVCLFGTLSAYALARFKFPGRELLYFAIIALLMVPGILTLVPTFVVILKLGLMNSWWGLWGPYIAGGQIMYIFIMRSFFASLPEALFESARIDGATELHIMTHIALPLSKSMVGTLAVLNLLNNWNEFVWPLMVVTDPQLMPITVGLYSFNHQFYTEYGPLFAGYVIASIPLIVLFSFASNLFVRGLTSGAIKM